MKVDSQGNPVNDGTWGMYGSYSARVERTYINPIDDDADTQAALNAGGYMVDMGKHGTVVTQPHNFTVAPKGPDVVIAQDGSEVHEGDLIELLTYGGALAKHAKKGVTVRSLYPIGALQGNICLSVKEEKGAAPDNYHAIGWGNVKRIIKRASAIPKDTKYRKLAGTTDVSKLTFYDYIEFLDDGNNSASGFIKELDDDAGYNGTVWIVNSESGIKPATQYLFKTKRITHLYSHKDGPWPTPVGFIKKGERFVTDNMADGETGVALDKAAFSPAEKHKGLIIHSGTTAKMKSGPDYQAFWAHTVIKIVPEDADADESEEWDGETIDPTLLQPGDHIVFLADDHKTKAALTISEVIDYILYNGHGPLDVSLSEDAGIGVGFDYWYQNKSVLYAERDGEVIYERTNTATTTGASMDMAKTGTDATSLSLNTLAEASRNKQAGKIDVVQTGTQIILPETGPAATLRGAILELTRRAEQDEMDVNVMELIDGYPLDAAHAFIRALENIFGWANALPTPGFFGPTPPTMVGIDIDADGHTVQIPWGQIGIPGVEGKLATGIQLKDGWPTFSIQGTIKQKDKKVVNQIATYARNYLKENSLYKGKAVIVRFPEEGKPWSPLDHQPKFIKTDSVRPEDLIFSKNVEKRIRVNVWTPIANNAAVRAAKVPLKRGVLLHGRYGVGKTLLASVTAQIAVQHGITFLDLHDSRQLPDAIRFARTFGGMVVIFAEDIDRCDENGTRTDAFNEILNTVDGLTSKTDEVLVVYTTNHIERISKAMLRQGRIDKVIEIPEPDAEAACRLIRLYARHMLNPEESITAVGTLIAGQKMIPAAIREIVEQSKLAAIERGDMHKITAEDLLITVEDTKAHNELLKEEPVDDRSEFERLGDAMGAQIAKVVEKVLVANGTEAYDEDGESIERAALAGEIGAEVQNETSKRRKAVA